MTVAQASWHFVEQLEGVGEGAGEQSVVGVGVLVREVAEGSGRGLQTVEQGVELEEALVEERVAGHSRLDEEHEPDDMARSNTETPATSWAC